MLLHPRVEQIDVNIHDTIYVCCYLLRGDRNVLIDTGITPAPRRDILPALERHGLALSDIDLILNTHGHPDHIGGNGAIKSAGGAGIFLCREEEPFLNDRETIFDLYSAPVFEAMGMNVAAEKESFLTTAGPSLSADRLLNDGDMIEIGKGMALRAVHLPGHSNGSMGFYWAEEAMLFSGDAVSGLHVGEGKLPIILDIGAYMRSLQRLQELPIRLLLCGHRYRALGLSTSSVRQGSDALAFIQQSYDLAEKIDAALIEVFNRQSNKSFVQLVDEVISLLPSEMGFLPITAVTAPFLTTQSMFFRLLTLGWQGQARAS
jgi:glyoxylase-like metal-dependent hydrolase (beta-lactamase superfamily II)